MQALTANPQMHDIHIIAITEPPHKKDVFATYVATNSPFIPFYPTDFHTRACILLNKNFAAHDIEPIYLPDLTVLSFTAHSHRLSIISLYNPPSQPTAVDPDSPILKLDNILTQTANNMVGLFGDFNLHHHEWSDRVRGTSHQLADNLLEITETHGLELITTRGLVTWQRHDQTSTLDLSFISTSLQDRLVSHGYHSPADCGSDHLPLLTTIMLDTPTVTPQPSQPKFQWKRMDPEQVAAGAQCLHVPVHLSSREAIDDYARYLQDFALDLASTTVPISRGNDTCKRRYQCPWWSDSIARLVRQERIARRHRYPQQMIDEATKRKKSAITEAKRRSWRMAVHEAKDSPKGIWSLTSWAKDRSHLQPEPPLMPPLERHDVPPATTFEEKAKVLHAQFFPPVPDADLTDIPARRDTYPDPLPCPVVSRETVQSALADTASWKSPGPDTIPTGFLKAMGAPLVDALQLLTQSSWDWQHAPMPFRTARTVVIRKPRKERYTVAKSWRPIALLNTLGKITEAVTTRYLEQLAEGNGMLPEQQMGARKGRSTETAIGLLLAQIRTVFKGKGAASVVTVRDCHGSASARCVVHL